MAVALVLAGTCNLTTGKILMAKMNNYVKRLQILQLES